MESFAARLLHHLVFPFPVHPHAPFLADHPHPVRWSRDRYRVAERFDPVEERLQVAFPWIAAFDERDDDPFAALPEIAVEQIGSEAEALPAIAVEIDDPVRFDPFRLCRRSYHIDFCLSTPDAHFSTATIFTRRPQPSLRFARARFLASVAVCASTSIEPSDRLVFHKQI